MKNILFILLACAATGCTKGIDRCSDSVTDNRILVYFRQNSNLVVPFTKIYAIEGGGAIGKNIGENFYRLPVVTTQNNTTFVLETGSKKDTLFVTYNLFNVLRDCDDMIAQNFRADTTRSTFKKVVWQNNAITINLP